MIVISKPINKDRILADHNTYFKTMIKAVVDINKKVIALNAELHADLEAHLLQQDSKQEDLWGINLYLEKPKADWIEYTAFINIRPSMNNRDMEVKNPELKKQIKEIVYALITE